jgi:hypothetical protein
MIIVIGIFICYSVSLDNWVLITPYPDNLDSGGYNNSNGNSTGKNSGGDNPGNNNLVIIII